GTTVAGSGSYFGVDQSFPTGSTGFQSFASQTSVSRSLNTLYPGGVLHSFVWWSGSVTASPGGGQTTRWNSIGSTVERGETDTLATSGVGPYVVSHNFSLSTSGGEQVVELQRSTSCIPIP